MWLTARSAGLEGQRLESQGEQALVSHLGSGNLEVDGRNISL